MSYVIKGKEALTVNEFCVRCCQHTPHVLCYVHTKKFEGAGLECSFCRKDAKKKRRNFYGVYKKK